MVNDSPKFGPSETDPEYELRLRKIEQDLTRRQATDPTAAATAADVELPGTPGGLRLISNVRSIVVEWNPVTGADRYEVQVADNSTFSGSNVDTFITSDNRFSFAGEIDAGNNPVEFFVRVVTIDVNGVRSLSSVILSTLTGQAVTDTFEDESVATRVAIFSSAPVTALAGATTVIQRLTVDTAGFPALILVVGSHRAVDATGSTAALHRLRRGGEILQEWETFPRGDIASSAANERGYAFFIDDTIGSEANVEYIHEVDITSPDAIFQNRSIFYLEVKK
jgi:hypothetical protein